MEMGIEPGGILQNQDQDISIMTVKKKGEIQGIFTVNFSDKKFTRKRVWANYVNCY